MLISRVSPPTDDQKRDDGVDDIIVDVQQHQEPESGYDGQECCQKASSSSLKSVV